MELTVGTIITGKVTTITKFGAFVALPGGKSGLVHISEVSGSFVTDVHDFLTEGQEVPVKVLSISPEGKISLSVKQAQPPKPRPQYADRPARPRPPRPNPARPNPSQPAAPPAELTFEDKLKQFMTASEGRMADLNRGMDGRRGRRRRQCGRGRRAAARRRGCDPGNGPGIRVHAPAPVEAGLRPGRPDR